MTYILRDMIPVVYDGDFIDKDLQILQADPNTGSDAHLIIALLDQIAGSEEIPWKLLHREDVHYSPYFNCKAITCFQNDGYNIYRIRPMETSRLKKYRVLYAYDAPRNKLHLLAIVIKNQNTTSTNHTLNPYDYDYEYDHPVSIRIRSEYDNRSFARI